MTTTTKPQRTKYLLPIGPSSRDARIHKEAREAAERALEALRELLNEDPWVARAVAEVAGQWWPQSSPPPAARTALREVRRVAHEGKVTSMLKVSRMVRMQVSGTEGGEVGEASQDAERRRHIENVVDVIGEYRAGGVELGCTMEKLFEVFDWDDIDVVRLQAAIHLLLWIAPASTVEQASKVADSERGFLADFVSEMRAAP